MSLRVLIVDDERSLLMTLGANLELEGFDVTEASGAREAIVRLERESFDVIVTDIRMPEMNGVDLFRAVKVLHPTTPVVLMTAFAAEGLVDEAIREGAYTVLPKPFDMQHLITAVALAVRRPAVLVVDRERAEAGNLASALRVVGLRAEVAATAADALSGDQPRDVDVCVIDVAATDEPTVALMRRLRALAPSLCVIAVANADHADLARALRSAAAVACMSRPVEPLDLVGTIARARAKPGHGKHCLKETS